MSNLQTSLDFVMVFNLVIALAVMYLWSSGAEYMIKAANDSDRSGKLDRIALGAVGAASLYGAFIRDPWVPYAQLFPLFVHLVQIAYLSAKFKHSQEPYRKKIIGRIISFLECRKPVQNHN